MISKTYTKKVMEYFRNPHNMGEMKNPDAVGKVGNPKCGDVMELYIRVEKDAKGREIIKDISFLTFGCVAAIATSSVLTDLAKGRSLKDAMSIENKDVAKALGGLPAVKIHCSVLAVDALRKAVENYRTGKK